VLEAEAAFGLGVSRLTQIKEGKARAGLISP
jgi:hypothetical protein